MTAYTFGLTSLETGRLLGEAIVCPQARYVSVAWRGAGRLDRKFVHAASWTRIERELADGWPNGIVDTRSAVGETLIADRVAVVVQLVSKTIIAGLPADIVRILDARLQSPPEEGGTRQ